jgi:hypothetical protein
MAAQRQRDEKLEEMSQKIAQAISLVQQQLCAEREVRAKGTHMKLFDHLLDVMEQKLENTTNLLRNLTSIISDSHENQKMKV